MVYGKYFSGTAGSVVGVGVGGTGVGVMVGVTGVDVEVGAGTGVLVAGWSGVRVGSISTAGWLCGVQAATVTIKEKNSSVILRMGSIISINGSRRLLYRFGLYRPDVCSHLEKRKIRVICVRQRPAREIFHGTLK